jgi:hypothetical protein
MGGSRETGHRELGVGSKTGVGEIDDSKLRRRDKGSGFLAMAGTVGTGGKQDGDAAD